MIGVAILHHDPGEFGPGKRIADLIVILASANLSDVTPIRSRVNNIRIIDPFRYFVRRNSRVHGADSKDPTGIEIKRGICLESQRTCWVDAMVSARAAIIEIRWIAERHTRVVEHKHWECLWVYAFFGKLCEGVGHDEVEKINVD